MRNFVCVDIREATLYLHYLIEYLRFWEYSSEEGTQCTVLLRILSSFSMFFFPSHNRFFHINLVLRFRIFIEKFIGSCGYLLLGSFFHFIPIYMGRLHFLQEILVYLIKFSDETL